MKRAVDDDGAGGVNSASTSHHSAAKMSRQQPIVLSNRLYFTKISGHPQRFSTNALSLSELLEAISPIASIHFNFMIDLPWLLSQYPAKCSQSPISIIVGENNGTNHLEIRSAAARCGADNVTVGRARLALPYGTHHTKLSLFESDSESIHVTISTANLLQNDWESKTQAFYHCEAPIMDGSEVEKEKNDEFRDDLISYLNVYSSSSDFEMIKYWRDRISNADFSSIKARIICSTPGYHTGEQMKKFGHLRLREVLYSLDLHLKKPTFVAQFSSIGSLGPKPDSWLTGQFLKSLSGGTSVPENSLRLIYPCVEDVRNSVEGYMAGGALPYQKSTAAKQPYLESFMHKWRCERFGRTRAMPHIKSYCAFNDGHTVPSWLLITSANLSKAAWGELQKKESQLAIRSYELGVLLTDEESLQLLPYDVPLTKFESGDKPWLCDAVYKKPDAAWGELQKKESQLAIRSYELGVLLTDEESLQLLPYDVPLTKFESGDKPWLCDAVYKKPDVFGATWMLD
ncbi:putative tyrosyl-DNA phosphodiesterase [Toxocara canis]|uniref:Putative tyrosyl-DNA phosphodiesterase n=1 Tax=Toxocara canis TaxID=6265 RepID=A0A0B2VA74_TOXCA|nr:putative tyrosyl-DNA phosphodiesterase [Toxocara canis]